MTAIQKLSGFSFVLLLLSCVPQNSVPQATSHPSGVSLYFTDEIKDTPAEETMGEIVRQCEAEGGRYCAGWTAGAEKKRFKSGDRVFIISVLRGLMPNSKVSAEMMVYDPDGDLTLRQRMPTDLPHDWTAKHELKLFYEIVAARPGQWRVDLLVNDEKELSRTFRIDEEAFNRFSNAKIRPANFSHSTHKAGIF